MEKHATPGNTQEYRALCLMPNSLTDANAVEPRSEEHAHIEQIRAHLRAARKLVRAIALTRAPAPC